MTAQKVLEAVFTWCGCRSEKLLRNSKTLTKIF